MERKRTAEENRAVHKITSEQFASAEEEYEKALEAFHIAEKNLTERQREYEEMIREGAELARDPELIMRAWEDNAHFVEDKLLEAIGNKDIQAAQKALDELKSIYAQIEKNVHGELPGDWREEVEKVLGSLKNLEQKDRVAAFGHALRFYKSGVPLSSLPQALKASIIISPEQKRGWIPERFPTRGR